MIDPGPSQAFAAGQVWAVVADVALKATLLLAAAWLLDRALRARHVLACSAVWNACLIALALLPLTAITFPRLRIACLPAETAVAEPSGRVAAGGTLWAEVAHPAPEQTHREATHPGDWEVGTIIPVPIVGAQKPRTPREPAIEPRGDPVAPVAEAAVPAAETSVAAVWWRSIGWQTWVLATYFVGVVIVAVRLAFSIRAVGSLRRSSLTLTDPAWTDALRRWCRRLGIERDVRLAHCERIDVSMVVGWLRPVILVPTPMAATVTARERNAILVHELAHVRRADFPWQLLLRVLQAVYWFHPLAWASARSIRSVRERACDDFCVHWLGNRREYAAALIDLAAAKVRCRRLALGLAAVRSSNIEQRLACIDQSPGSPRCRCGWPIRTLVLGTAAALAIMLGSVELSRADVAAEEPAVDAPGPAADTDPSGAAADAAPDDAAGPADAASTPEALFRRMVAADDWRERRKLAGELAALGEKALPLVIEEAKHGKSDYLRRECYFLLMDPFAGHPKAIETLISHGLKDHYRRISYNCAYHLGTQKAEGAIEALRAAMRDPETPIYARYAAAKSLAELGQTDCIRMIYEGLGSDSYNLRSMSNTGAKALTGKDLTAFDYPGPTEGAEVIRGQTLMLPFQPITCAEWKARRFRAIADWSAWLKQEHPKLYEELDTALRAGVTTVAEVLEPKEPSTTDERAPEGAEEKTSEDPVEAFKQELAEWYRARRHWYGGDRSKLSATGMLTDAAEEEHKRSPAVRAYAYKLLMTEHSDHEWTTEAVAWNGLRDSDPEIRIMCALYLGRRKVYSAVRRLNLLLEWEAEAIREGRGSERVKYAALAALAMVEEADVIGQLYWGLASDRHEVRHLANLGIESLSGKDLTEFGYSGPLERVRASDEDQFVEPPPHPVDDARWKAKRWQAIAEWAKWLKETHTRLNGKLEPQL
ncbi:MAG: M56 family metallopeptidase [Planctomycetota bacterium]|jgi:beta-lactamase regulating signal transducer with metallopeptidase domain